MDLAYFGPGKHFAFPYKDKAARETLVVVLKYTFKIGPSGRAEFDEDAAAPSPIDEYNGTDASRASIRRPSDLYEHKPGTDVILVGHAHAPLRGSATHVDVSLRVGPIAKTVRAHGPRVWKQGLRGGLAPGPTRPIQEPVPLLYELAWGGLDLSDPERPVGEPRNLVGRGVAPDPAKLVGQPAAQLEDPAHPLDGRSPAPASFGAIHRHWQPRAAFAGTYDDAWMESKMPLPPDDYDPRFNVSVPHDQWSPAPLRGDEPIEIRGATPEGLWRFQLPRIAPGFSSRARGARAEHRSHLDTIFIDADRSRVELTWRAQVPMPRKYELLERVYIVEKQIV
ncbi:DUF2169 family type VI secretion system accessory protein [Sorangium cellulosum]|uniref:DUF2169 domain-containing protein n=1 Tax=Sorangium cellulosum So0157-2 TaxID=1254432 RepID=S4XVU1_SORCE|nr:DUF2169 domain-containing protein [Sorangium cellulosum]AGP36441.1 hypothetical protein SCE1572_19265 [Sorangium cellulosum So0157-2]